MHEKYKDQDIYFWLEVCMYPYWDSPIIHHPLFYFQHVIYIIIYYLVFGLLSKNMRMKIIQYDFYLIFSLIATLQLWKFTVYLPLLTGIYAAIKYINPIVASWFAAVSNADFILILKLHYTYTTTTYLLLLPFFLQLLPILVLLMVSKMMETNYPPQLR